MDKRTKNPNTVVEGWKDAAYKDYRASGQKKAGVYFAKKADKILHDLGVGVRHKRMRHA